MEKIIKDTIHVTRYWFFPVDALLYLHNTKYMYRKSEEKFFSPLLLWRNALSDNKIVID